MTHDEILWYEDTETGWCGWITNDGEVVYPQPPAPEEERPF